MPKVEQFEALIDRLYSLRFQRKPMLVELQENGGESPYGQHPAPRLRLWDSDDSP